MTLPVPVTDPLLVREDAMLKLLGFVIVTMRPVATDKLLTESTPSTVGSFVSTPDGIVTSLEDVGTKAGLQLPAVFQLVLEEPVQVDVPGAMVTVMELVL